MRSLEESALLAALEDDPARVAQFLRRLFPGERRLLENALSLLNRELVALEEIKQAANLAGKESPQRQLGDAEC
jgi:RNA polymerase-interacting CarD/CdnL/TRCF family regulator